MNINKIRVVFYKVLQVTVFMTVLAISTALTVNLFSSFSDDPIQKILWIVLGCTIEIASVYFLSLAKAYFEKETWGKVLVFTFTYLALSTVSLISNTGYSLSSIETKNNQVALAIETSDTTNIDRKISNLEEAIEEAKIDREDLRTQKRELPADWDTRKKVLSEAIDEKTKSIDKMNNELDELYTTKQGLVKEESIESVGSRDIFSALGNDKLDGNSVRLYLMLFISFIIEVVKALTCGTYPLKEEEENIEEVTPEPVVVQEEPIIPEPKNTFQMNIDKAEMFKYIDALMADGIERLRQDQAISEETGIPLLRCKSYRKQLLAMSYDNKPLMQSKRGVGSWANYPKKTIVKLLDIQQKLNIA